MNTDFCDASRYLLGWSNLYSVNNACEIVKSISSLEVANPDPDVATLVWYRVFSYVPRTSWDRYTNFQERSCGLHVLLQWRRFDALKIMEWLSLGAFVICISFAISSKQRGTLKLNIKKDGALEVVVREAGFYKANADFFQPLVRIFGLEKFARFQRGNDPKRPGSEYLYYEILNRHPENLELFSLGFEREADTGLFTGGHFYIRGEAEIVAYLKSLETNKDLASLEVIEAELYRLPYPEWERARQSLQMFEPKECVLTICNKDSYKWEPPNPVQEMEENDLITLGYLGGPGLPKGIGIPRFMRERLLSVDLVREGEGWAFCLTSLDRELNDNYRQRINEYLNEQLGFQFITRGVKERWGKLLTKRK